MSTAISVATTAINRYVPRGRNELRTIFERHFEDFCEYYEEKYVPRIRWTNPECGLVSGFRHLLGQGADLPDRTDTVHPGHDYFRPFSCKGFYLCPRMHGQAATGCDQHGSHSPAQGRRRKS